MRFLTGHKGAVNAVAYSPCGTLMATGGEDKTLQLWDPVSGAWKRTKHVRRPISAVAFHPTEPCLVFGCDSDTGAGNEFQSYSWLGEPAVVVTPPHGIAAARIESVQFSPSGGTLLACPQPAGRPGQFVGYLVSWRFTRSGAGWTRPEPAGHRTELLEVNAAVVSRDDGHAILGTDRGLWVLRLTPDATPVSWPTLSGGTVSVLAMAPGRDRVGYGSPSRVGALPLTLQAAGSGWTRPASVWALAFTPCGRSLLGGGADGLVTVWDAATGAEYHRLDFGLGSVRGVAANPDGLTAAACGDRGVVVFDLG